MTSPVEAGFEEARTDAVNIISSRNLPKLYVEGRTDKYILNHHFHDVARVVVPEQGQIQDHGYKKGGKNLVKMKVKSDEQSYGFVDMDHDFNSSFTNDHSRIKDSSPKACLVALLLSETEILEFIYRVLRKHGINTSNVGSHVFKIAIAHSISIWYRGMSGDKGDQVTTRNDQFMWRKLFDNTDYSEVSDLLMTLPNGNHLNLFFQANKTSISNAGIRDHSLVSAIAEYVFFATNGENSLDQRKIEQKLSAFAKYQKIGDKLVSFHQEIKTGIL